MHDASLAVPAVGATVVVVVVVVVVAILVLVVLAVASTIVVLGRSSGSGAMVALVLEIPTFDNALTTVELSSLYNHVTSAPSAISTTSTAINTDTSLFLGIEKSILRDLLKSVRPNGASPTKSAYLPKNSGKLYICMFLIQILSFINAKKPVEETGFTRFMTKPVIAIAIIVGCFIFTRISYAVLSLVVKRIADRPPTNAANWWKNSVRRIGSETIEGREQRRRQRIDAATRMLHHFISLAAWIISLIAIFNVLDLNAAFFLSSAGFLGAGLAVGGQHRVNDYLTGLAVLLEDRYGVGDEVEAELGWQKPIHGFVEHVGMVTTRLRDGVSTVHIPHSQLSSVRNLSQEPVTTRLEMTISPSNASANTVSNTMRDLAGTKGLTTVLFVDDIEAAGEGDRVELNVRTSRPLTEHERELLVQRASEVLSKDK